MADQQVVPPVTQPEPDRLSTRSFDGLGSYENLLGETSTDIETREEGVQIAWWHRLQDLLPSTDELQRALHWSVHFFLLVATWTIFPVAIFVSVRLLVSLGTFEVVSNIGIAVAVLAARQTLLQILSGVRGRRNRVGQ
jgi:hypothetical protein